MKRYKSTRAISRSFRNQKDFRRPVAASMGDLRGIVDVPNRQGYIYVTINSRDVIEVYNNKIATLAGIRVWVGIDPKEPHLMQVLGIRDNVPRGGISTGDMPTFVQPHHKTHEWMAGNGGNDIVFSELRQFMPLRPTLMGGMNVGIFRSVARLSDSWLGITGLEVDMSPYVPVTGSRFALVYQSASGIIGVQSGDVKDLLTLGIDDIPAPTYGTLPIAAVRLYEGQTGIYESRTYTDIIDLRFPMWHSHTALELPNPFVFATTATAQINASGWITANGNYMYINPFDLDAGDVLVGIYGGVNRQLLVLATNSDQVLTISSSLGNIRLSGGTDYELSGDKTLLLFYDSAKAIWVDLGGTGGGGDNLSKILVVHTDMTTQSFDNSINGMDQAIANSSSGDVILVPPCSLGGTYICPENVTINGRGTMVSIFTGKFFGSNNGQLTNLAVIHSETNASGISTIYPPTSGTFLLNNVRVTNSNNGGGDAYGVYVNASGSISIRNSYIQAIATGGSSEGYGSYRVPTAFGSVTGVDSTVLGSTASTNE